MIYTVAEGSIHDPANLVMDVKGIYLLDVGSGVYTEFSAGHKIIDVYDEFPLLMDEPEVWKLGKIHSHHNMKAYHSGTDMGDLHVHSETHAFYTSLVVNFDEEYDCKIGIKCTEADRQLVHKDGKGGECTSIIKGESWLMVVDVDIIMPEVEEGNIPAYIIKELDAITTKHAEAKAKAVQNSSMYGAWGKNNTPEQYGLPFEEEPDEEDYCGFTETEIKGFIAAWLENDIKTNTLMISALRKAIATSKDAGGKSFLSAIFQSFVSIAIDYFNSIDEVAGDIQGYTPQLAQGCIDYLSSSSYSFLEDSLTEILDILDAQTLIEQNDV